MINLTKTFQSAERKKREIEYEISALQLKLQILNSITDACQMPNVDMVKILVEQYRKMYSEKKVDTKI